MQDLIANLRDDTRHSDVVALDWSEEKRERLYPDWEMEQVKADDIREVLQDALASAADESNIAALRRILEQLDAGPLGALGRS